MAIKIHIAIKCGHLGALHHISIHTGRPSLITSWSATKGFVFRGNGAAKINLTIHHIDAQKQVPFKVTAIAMKEHFDLNY